MNRSHWVSEKITPTHIAKLAYIYIRQSTMGQVTKHRESTELQYRLSQRAESLGWPADAIKIIDEDLGRSGSSSVERPGFQQLITEIGLGRVGMVLSYGDQVEIISPEFMRRAVEENVKKMSSFYKN